MKYFILVLLGLAAALPGLRAESVSPSATPPESALTNGKNGNGFQPVVGRALSYPIPLMDLGAGTISLWVNLRDAAASVGQIPLVSSGAPPATWFFLHVNEGRLGLVFQKGAKPFTAVGDFYLNTSVDISDWSADSWHHVVISWAANAREGGTVIVVDGSEREARFNVPLGSGQSLANLTFGNNSAQLSAAPGAVTFDDIKAWNVPLSPSQIQQVFKGETPEPDALVLSADFESGWEANGTATLSPDLSNPEALVSRLRE